MLNAVNDVWNLHDFVIPNDLNSHICIASGLVSGAHHVTENTLARESGHAVSIV